MLYVAFDGLSASAGCLLQFYQPGLSLSWAVGILLERFLAVFLDLKCQTCSVFHPWSKKADLEKTKEMENYTGKSKNATVVSTHYLYLSLQFYRSLTISTSRITAMKSVGKNIILRKYWRQIRTTTLWLQNKLLLGCHVIRRLFVVWTNYTTSFFFIELLVEEISTPTFASVLGEKCCYQSQNKKLSDTDFIVTVCHLLSDCTTCLHILFAHQSPFTITRVKHNVFALNCSSNTTSFTPRKDSI